MFLISQSPYSHKNSFLYEWKHFGDAILDQILKIKSTGNDFCSDLSLKKRIIVSTTMYKYSFKSCFEY